MFRVVVTRLTVQEEQGTTKNHDSDIIFLSLCNMSCSLNHSSFFLLYSWKEKRKKGRGRNYITKKSFTWRGNLMGNKSKELEGWNIV